MFDQRVIAQAYCCIFPSTDMISAGEPMKELAASHRAAYVKFHKGFHALQAILLEPRNTQPDIVVLVRKTGTGKSKQAREILADNPYVWGPELFFLGVLC